MYFKFDFIIRGAPIQYLTGFLSYFSQKLYVNKGVLIYARPLIYALCSFWHGTRFGTLHCAYAYEGVGLRHSSYQGILVPSFLELRSLCTVRKSCVSSSLLECISTINREVP